MGLYILLSLLGLLSSSFSFLSFLFLYFSFLFSFPPPFFCISPSCSPFILPFNFYLSFFCISPSRSPFLFLLSSIFPFSLFSSFLLFYLLGILFIFIFRLIFLLSSPYHRLDQIFFHAHSVLLFSVIFPSIRPFAFIFSSSSSSLPPVLQLSISFLLSFSPPRKLPHFLSFTIVSFSLISPYTFLLLGVSSSPLSFLPVPLSRATIPSLFYSVFPLSLLPSPLTSLTSLTFIFS